MISNFEKAIKILEEKNNYIFKEIMSEETKQFLLNYQVNDKIIKDLEKVTFMQDLEFNNVWLYKINDLEKNNNFDEYSCKCIKNGYLIIGAGLNGDPIVIDIKTDEIGFIFHDQLWEDDNIEIKDIFISMKCSIFDFYANSILENNYPVDGYKAEEYTRK